MTTTLRALIVEDDLNDRRQILTELRRGGFDVDPCFVETAESFTAALNESHWDVVLADYSVPGFGGAAALELLNASHLDLPFIIVSGPIGHETAAALIRMGASDCLDKDNGGRIAPAVARELAERDNRQARRHAEETRDDALYRLRLQIRRMPMGYVLFDKNFHITDWNHAAEKIFGFTKGEVLAMAPPYPQLVPASTHATLTDIFRRVADGAMDAQSINENLTKSGRRILCQWWNTPLTDAHGQFDGLMALAEDVTARERSDQQLRNQTEQLRALSASLTTARENERMRIARELHDQLGSTLTALKWDLELVSAAVPTGDDGGSLRSKIAALAVEAQTAIVAVQRIATELRPSILDDLGLVHAVQWQAQDFAQRTGIPCECACDDDDLVFSTDQATAVFRIVQEALTNVARHARATRVRVTMKLDKDEFLLEVIDNGVGILAQQQSSRSALGLLGMRERAALVNASVTITGAPGTGTKITVRLPIAATT